MQHSRIAQLSADNKWPLLTCSDAPVHYDPNQSSHIHLQETSVNLWELMLGQVDCQVVHLLPVAFTEFLPFALLCDRFSNFSRCIRAWNWRFACTKRRKTLFWLLFSTDAADQQVCISNKPGVWMCVCYQVLTECTCQTLINSVGRVICEEDGFLWPVFCFHGAIKFHLKLLFFFFTSGKMFFFLKWINSILESNSFDALEGLVLLSNLSLGHIMFYFYLQGQ